MQCVTVTVLGQFLSTIWLWQLALGLDLEFDKDLDIQEALIGVARRENRGCPLVLIYDEQMPELSMSYKFMKRMQFHYNIFVVINLSTSKLPELEKRYKTRDTTLILQTILYNLYRKSRCYLFVIWVKDPRLLYPETQKLEYRLHPGWRQSDKVVVVVYHITKRYKSLISLKFWDYIPNILGVKRGKMDEEGVSVNVFTVLPFLIDGKRKSQEIEVWLVTEKKFVTERKLFFDRYRNLHGAMIQLGVLWKEPFFIWGNVEDPYMDGLDWRIFALCQKQLNFTFNVTSVSSTGRIDGNGSWSGMMGLIADGSIDVGVGGIAVTSDRLQYFDFCRTYYTDSINFIVPHNRRSKSAAETLMQPFDDYVWLAVFFTMIIGMLTLQLVTVLQKSINDRFCGPDEFQDSLFLSPSVASGFLFTVFCQKSYRYLPTAFSIQCVFYGTCLTIFILGMAFSSCLISVILNQKEAPIADKIDDILSSGLQISIKNYDGYLNDYMESSSSPVLRNIYKKAKLVNYFESFNAMDQVVIGNQIYVDSKAKIYFTGRYIYNGSEGLKFHVSSDSILKFSNLGWPVQKHWPLMEKFDAVISRAVESGLIGFWMNEFVKGKFGGDALAWKIPRNKGWYLPKKMVGIQDVDPSTNYKGGFVPLSMHHLEGLIGWFYSGVFAGVVAFIAECILGAFSVIMRFFHSLISKLRVGKKIKPAKSVSQDLSEDIDCNLKNTTIGGRTPERKHFFKPSRQMQLDHIPQLVWNDFETTRRVHQNIRNSSFDTVD